MDDSMPNGCASPEISEQDVLEAMKAMQGYIDITPADFREVYRFALAAAQKRIMDALKVADIMSAPVHAVENNMDLIQAASLLAEKGVSGAPVVDRQGKVVGVVSEKDFLVRMGGGSGGSFMLIVANCLKNKDCVASPWRKQTVCDIMSAPAITARADTSATDAAALIKGKNVNRLPIVDGAERPVGIVTRSDLVHGYCQLGGRG